MPDEANLMRELEEVLSRIERRRQQQAQDEARRDALLLELLRGRSSSVVAPPAARKEPPGATQAQVTSPQPLPPVPVYAAPTELLHASPEVLSILGACAKYKEPFSPADVARDTKYKLSTMRYHFARAEAAGRIRRVSRGLYELTPLQREAFRQSPPAGRS